MPISSRVDHGTGFPLAIVIPACTGRFLAEALRSVAAQQMDRCFPLFVGGDGSPGNLEAIFRDSPPLCS